MALYLSPLSHTEKSGNDFHHRIRTSKRQENEKNILYISLFPACEYYIRTGAIIPGWPVNCM